MRRGDSERLRNALPAPPRPVVKWCVVGGAMSLVRDAGPVAWGPDVNSVLL